MTPRKPKSQKPIYIQVRKCGECINGEMKCTCGLVQRTIEGK